MNFPGLSKVIVGQTDRQTDVLDQNYIPRCFAGGQSTKTTAVRWTTWL